MQRTGGGDSWMQRVERNRNGGKRREEKRGQAEGGLCDERDGCICASRARYRDEFHSPDRFRREDATRTVLDLGIHGIPEYGEGYGEPRIRRMDSPTAGVESAGDRIPGIRSLYHVLAFANIRISVEDSTFNRDENCV